MNGAPEFKVGLFVLACIAIVVFLSFKVNNDPSVGGKTQKFNLLLPNANGIVKNSHVKMAGIPVGLINNITLDNGTAKLELKLQGGIKVTKSASVEIKPNGILGDKYIEISPGDPKDEALPEGAAITQFHDNGGFDAILNQVGKIAGDVGEITSSLKKATTGDGDDDSPIGRVLHNIEDLTADLREISDNKKDKLQETIDHIHSISKNIDEFVGDESEDGFKKNWKKMAKSLGRVDDILKNVDEVTAKVNQGQGTLGKLVNDETTVEELNHAIEGVNTMLDAGNKIQLSLDYHSEVMAGPLTKSYIGINVQPGPDRFYIVQLVDDPKGSFERNEALQTVNGGPATLTSSQNLYHNKFKFSAEFAKTFYDLTVRAGVIESSGGAGVDYSLFKRKLKLSAELFGFSRIEGAYLRLYARYKFYSVFYAAAGGDDLLNNRLNPLTGTSASGFIGAGLDFTNDDLKLLLTKVPL